MTIFEIFVKSLNIHKKQNVFLLLFRSCGSGFEHLTSTLVRDKLLFSCDETCSMSSENFLNLPLGNDSHGFNFLKIVNQFSKICSFSTQFEQPEKIFKSFDTLFFSEVIFLIFQSWFS